MDTHIQQPTVNITLDAQNWPTLVDNPSRRMFDTEFRMETGRAITGQTRARVNVRC